MTENQHGKRPAIFRLAQTLALEVFSWVSPSDLKWTMVQIRPWGAHSRDIRTAFPPDFKAGAPSTTAVVP